jgi:AcrR family transcriptional regulator
MARTQADDYEEKRAAIRDSAATLFAQKGFAAASIAEIARASGVSKSLIYHYYNAKDDILFDLMSAHVQELFAVASEPSPEEPQAAFKVLTRRLLARYVGAAAKQKVLLDELHALPETRRRAIVETQRAIIARVETALCAARPALAADGALLRVKAMLYFGMLNWTHTWFDPDGPVTRERLADMAAETILNAP